MSKLSALATACAAALVGACTETVLQPNALSENLFGASTIRPAEVVGVANLQVTGNRAYRIELGALGGGQPRFIDANTTFASPFPPELEGLTYIRTADADRNAALGSSDFLSFDVDRDAIVFVAHEARLQTPAWLSSSFVDTRFDLRDADRNRLRIYRREVKKGTVTLGSNLDRSMKNGTMYSVFLAASERPTDEPPPPPAPSEPEPGPADPIVANECDAPDPSWIWCDDFEQDRLTRYFEYDSRNGSFVRVGGVGRDGSHGMRVRWATGQVNAGSLKLAIGATPAPYFRAVDDGTAKYREVYWRMYLRNQSGWTGGGADKLSRATVFAGGDWSQAMIAHVWSGGSTSTSSFLVADPASGTDIDGNLVTTKYNDFDNLRWLGAARGNTPLFADTETGKWRCVEAYVRLNDAGLSNGVFRIWVDGELDSERQSLNWLGSYSSYGINAVFFENY
jgi:hypothetical protein